MRRKVWQILMLACVVALGLDARAQTVDVARPPALDDASIEAALTLGAAGLEAYRSGEYRVAREKLEKAYAVAPVPTLGLWSARALEKLGRLLEAEARYRETLELPIPEDKVARHREAKAAAQVELARLVPRIPTLIVTIEGARPEAVRVMVDGRTIAASERARRLDPGAHRVEAQLGTTEQVLEVSLRPGETRTLLMAFHPVGSLGGEAPGSPTPSATGDRRWMRWAGWSAAAAGALGLGVGTVATFAALSVRDDMEASPSCNVELQACGSGQRALVDRYESRRVLSNVSFIAGGVLAAAGVTLLALDSMAEGPSARATVGGGMLRVEGRF